MTQLQSHVAMSLIGIASGFVVGLLLVRPLCASTAVFLTTMILTSATGFLLPPFGFDPPRAVGMVSLVLLEVSVITLYLARLKSAWRLIYVGTAMAALYLNVFVGVTQAFAKLPALHAHRRSRSCPS